MLYIFSCNHTTGVVKRGGLEVCYMHFVGIRSLYTDKTMITTDHTIPQLCAFNCNNIC